MVDEYLVGYCLRYRSATFAKYALGHVSRLLGAEMIVDIDEAPVLRYQEDRLEDRLREKAASKSINEEVRFLLKMLGDSGEVIRGRLRKKKQLKLAVRKNMGKRSMAAWAAFRSLDKEQWLRILGNVSGIEAFIRDDESRLKSKE